MPATHRSRVPGPRILCPSRVGRRVLGLARPVPQDAHRAAKRHRSELRVHVPERVMVVLPAHPRTARRPVIVVHRQLGGADGRPSGMVRSALAASARATAAASAACAASSAARSALSSEGFSRVAGDWGSTSVKARDTPWSAEAISLGGTQKLFPEPCASWGSVWRYW